MLKRLLLFIFVTSVSYSLVGQTYTYRFNNDFTEAGGAGPDLIPIIEPPANSLTCGTSPSLGTFNTHVVSSACPGSPITKVAYDFEKGGGVQFDNSSNFIQLDYTISIAFTFNTYSVMTPISQRIFDISNATRDNGFYVSDVSLNLVGGTVVGGPYTFAANTFAMVTLVRDDVNQLVSAYLNGQLYSTLDISGGFDPYAPISTSFINFFVDDNSGPCDEGDGVVTYISLTPAVSNAAAVLAEYNAVCATVLPLHLLDFSASKQSNAVSLKWITENEVNTSHFDVERSSDGRTFNKLSSVTANSTSSRSNYSFIDQKPLAGVGFYRIRMVDRDGRLTYSGIVKINFDRVQKFEVFPNPVRGTLSISGIQANKTIKLLNTEGKELFQKISTGQSMTIEMNRFPTGVYIVSYSDGQTVERIKIVNNN